MRVTVPVGVPPLGATAATVAVKITGWPYTEGLTEEARVVAVSAGLTVLVKAPEVFVLKLASPL